MYENEMNDALQNETHANSEQTLKAVEVNDNLSVELKVKSLDVKLAENSKNIVNSDLEISSEHTDEIIPHLDFVENENLQTEATENHDPTESNPKIIIHSVVNVKPVIENLVIVPAMSLEKNNESEDAVAEKSKNNKKKRLQVIDSDSETEETVSTKEDTKSFSFDDDTEGGSKHLKKRVTLFDSDSEDEDTIRKENALRLDDNLEKIYGNSVNNADSNTEDTNLKFEDNFKKKSDNSVKNVYNEIQQKLKGLCDSDTASESDDNYEKDEVSEKVRKPPIKSAKQRLKESLKRVQMNAKQAAKEKQEIFAESQRRTREAPISLPYHRPKNRTITEFLQKRPCLSTAVPVYAKVPAAIAIKMSVRELELTSKKLEERKKVVEEFYKSDTSDSDDVDDDKENGQKGDLNILLANDVSVPEIPTESKISDMEISFHRDEELKGMEETKVSEEKTDVENFVQFKPSFDEENEKLQETEVDCNISAETAAMQETNDKSNEEIHEMKDQTEGDELNNQNNSQPPEETFDTMDESSGNKRSSEEYTINLDSPEEQEEKNDTENQQQYLNSLIEKYADKTEIVQKPKSRLALLQEKFANSKPKLSGSLNDVIDLDDGTVRKNDITNLMERFMKHAQPQHLAKNNELQISVMNATHGEIHKETLTMPHEDEEVPIITEKPGAKLQKLREELQSKILQQRTEMWQKKKQQHAEENETNDVEEENAQKDGFEDRILDDEEEEELTESEEDDEEEVVVEKEKPRIKSAFFDEEAEVSGEDDEAENDVDADDENEDVNAEECDESDDEVSENVDAVLKKPRKRILNTFDEDSNSNDKNNEDIECSDRTVTLDDDEPPCYQQQLVNTPARVQTQTKPEFGFLSPNINLTGLQSNSKFLLESPVEATKSPVNMESSPLIDKTWHSHLQKKLFQEQSQQTQVDSDIISYTPQIQIESQIPQFQIQETQPTTQDLEDICSGNFTEMSQIDLKNDKTIGTQNKTEDILISEEQTAKVDDEDETFITQILNEDEMEKFKQKFVSPPAASENILNNFSADDDEEDDVVQNKRKRKRLVFSDDEDGFNEVAEDDEESIGLHDEDDETNDSVKVVDYDSEENEILETEVEQVGLRLKDFVENEAELSESDWDSEDEDEKGLDRLEKEEGDDEKFDEDKLRTDLEKIHMRRILDEDNREVRMLQEILLDDGELHGSGRQRQFRWRNVDDDTETENRNCEDLDVYVDDDETEEEWRRKRHEREMFLKKEFEKSQRRGDIEDPLEGLTDSQILKLGQAALRKTQQNTPNEKSSERVVKKSEPFLAAFSNKRGSFLSRADNVLARIAEMTKVSADVVVAGAKSTKNVVFHSVQSTSYEETTFVEQMGRKRKGTVGTPRIIKKLRMQSSVVDEF